MDDRISRRDFFLSLLAGAIAVGVPVLSNTDQKAKYDGWSVRFDRSEIDQRTMFLYRYGELVRQVQYRTAFQVKLSLASDLA